MGGRTRRLRNAARRAGTPQAKGRAMMAIAPTEDAPVVAPKKKKAKKKAQFL